MMNFFPKPWNPEQIKTLRLRFGSQQDAENATGIGQRQWSEWEAGKRTLNTTTRFALDRIEWLFVQDATRDLEPCPNCDRADFINFEENQKDTVPYILRCILCKQFGVSGKTVDLARRQWNVSAANLKTKSQPPRKGHKK